MADTIRTLAQLKTLLADNTIGNISAQDIRDFLVSVFNFVNDGSGNVSLTGNVAITDGSITLSADETVDGLNVSDLIGHKGAGGNEHAVASVEANGFMQAAYFSKLVAIENNADVTANHAPQGHPHAAADINSGILNIARIPNLSAGKITSDTFNLLRIPTIPYTKISSDYYSGDYLNADGKTLEFRNGILKTAPYYAS